MGLCDEEAMGFWWRPRVDDRTKSLSSRVQMISELMSLVEESIISNILHSDYKDSFILCNMPQNGPNGFFS